jgi:hypothetical protein
LNRATSHKLKATGKRSAGAWLEPVEGSLQDLYKTLQARKNRRQKSEDRIQNSEEGLATSDF